MKTEYPWKSRLASYLSGYLNEMRIVGYKFTVQERILRQFDQYCFDKNAPLESLSKEDVETFCIGDHFEVESTRQKRICLMQGLAEYMQRFGYEVYVHPSPDKAFTYPTCAPHIYTEAEMKKMFSVIDEWEQVPNSHSNRRVVDPLLFRMLYGCGLRVEEALNLKICDVELEEGTLRILKSKNNKDRTIPMSAGLTQRCRIYNATVHTFGKPDAYYFGGLQGGKYDQSTIYRRFRQYLWKAGISHSGKGPRVHDFRHSHCVHCLKRWVLSGMEITNLLPYLSAYLGHADFRGTQYYLRLTADLYPDIVSRMEAAYDYIIPERGSEDETNDE